MVLAFITLPVILLSQAYSFKVTMVQQACIVVVTSFICQLWRRDPLRDLFGPFTIHWLRMVSAGLLIGAILMLIPGLFLFIFGQVSWHSNSIDWGSILSTTLILVGVAVAEEVLFRGFIFQRLMAGIGKWPAQFVISGYFLLTHLNNPGMIGTSRLLGGINIFIASLLFGVAYIKSNSLAMPIGIHFMANWMQGVVLGFGVSGHQQTSFLTPIWTNQPDWLTGGNFGLEASLPGLIWLCILLFILYIWKPASLKNNALHISPVYQPSHSVDSGNQSNTDL